MSRPLQNKTVLITRAQKQASELTALLEEQGATVLEVPAIEIVLLKESLPDIQRALQNIPDYAWLLLTSVNSVAILDDVLKQMQLDWNIFAQLKIGCIGSSTADAVRSHGANVSLVPDRYQAEGLVEALAQRPLSGKKILLPRAAGSRDVLPNELSAMGAIVDEIHLYRAEAPTSGREKLAQIFSEQTIDFITFTSSSTVHNFVEMAGDLVTQLKNVRIVSIGPITAATLRQYGLPPAIEAKEFTMAGLVEAIVRSL